jgi:hypothetical protein
MFSSASRVFVVGVLLLLLSVLLPAAAIAGASVKPYVTPVGGEYDIKPLLSVGDTVPEASDPSKKYQMVGIPDGLGAHKNRDGTVTLYMSHEFSNNRLAEIVVGDPLSRGAVVSKLRLDKRGEVLSGERAYDMVFIENTLVGPAAQADNTTPAFARFCSASLAEPAQTGFDRLIYFANEESDAPNTFDGKGGLTVAIFDNEAHALPRLGRFSKENTLVMPGSGYRTVIMTLEDGPSTPDSQLYMYVGTKDRSRGASVLARNGLDNGKLYVFVSMAPGKNDELGFQSGSIVGRWVEIPNAHNMTDVELEAASDALGAFGFVRIEDGAFSKTDRDDFFFVTTGGNKSAGNELGRLYQLSLNRGNPTSPARLEVVYNADHVVAAGGDIALSPDNLDTSKDYLMINEDGTAQSRAVMAAKGRDGAIWRFDLKSRRGRTSVDLSSALIVAELNPPGRDGVAVGPGVWETSGIIDASGLYGKDSWLVDVQAHSPTAAPAPNTVEDGQLLLMTRADDEDDDDDDDDDDE